VAASVAAIVPPAVSVARLQRAGHGACARSVEGLLYRKIANYGLPT
jgi:hypothetical protein